MFLTQVVNRGVNRNTSSTKIDRQGGTLVLAEEDIVSITLETVTVGTGNGP